MSANLVPRVFVPLDQQSENERSGSNPGATISSMRHRCRPLVKGNEDSRRTHFKPTETFQHTLHLLPQASQTKNTWCKGQFVYIENCMFSKGRRDDFKIGTRDK